MAPGDQSSDGAAWETRLRDGDVAVLGELFAQHRQRLGRIVRFRMDARLAGRVDVDDVLQEAFLAASQRLDHFRQRKDMGVFVWLRLIVAQTVVDLHRRHLGAQARDVGREIPLHRHNPAYTTSASLAAWLAGSMTSPSRAVARDEMLQKLEAVIDQLEPIDREVLALRHFEELTNQEIAEVLGIQQKAASIRYVRAIKRLKDKLTSLPGFEGTGPIP